VINRFSNRLKWPVSQQLTDSHQQHFATKELRTQRINPYGCSGFLISDSYNASEKDNSPLIYTCFYPIENGVPLTLGGGSELSLHLAQTIL
jgi:hypothetical protein